MKFKLIEDYTNFGYMFNDIEVASDNSDEEVDLNYNQNSSKEYFPLNKTFIITIEGKPQQKIKANNRKEAANKCRNQYKDKIKILGIKEI